MWKSTLPLHGKDCEEKLELCYWVWFDFYLAQVRYSYCMWCCNHNANICLINCSKRLLILCPRKKIIFTGLVIILYFYICKLFCWKLLYNSSLLLPFAYSASRGWCLLPFMYLCDFMVISHNQIRNGTTKLILIQQCSFFPRFNHIIP